MTDEERDPADGLLNEDDRPGQNLNRGAPHDVPQESIELRVRRLEDIAFEGDGLTRAVTRLGLNASALGEALMQVDRNQQQLTRLGGQLAAVEEKVVTKEQLVEQARLTAEREKAARRRRTQKLTAWGIAGLAVVALVSLGLLQRAEERQRDNERYQQAIFEVCSARNDQNTKVRAFIVQQTLPPEQVKLITDAFKPINCERLR